jgi:Fe-S-cluster containining protein
VTAKLEDAKIHLEVFGQTRIVDTRVRVGDDATLLDLWPTARDISREITQASIESATSEGRSISCKPGCAACCRHLAPISTLEATSLFDVVHRMPDERRARVRARFADAVKTMEDAGLVDRDAPKGHRALRSRETDPKAQWDDVSRRYWSLQIACPFLEDEACIVYDDRPMVCREYHVTTPVAYCDTFDARTRGIDRPVRMSEVLAGTVGRVAGLDDKCIPLALSFEWAEAHGESMRAPHDGEETFRAMMDVLQDKVEG